MKKGLAATIATGLFCLTLSSPASSAITEKECKDAGGSWDGTKVIGVCKIKMTAVKLNIPQPNRPRGSDDIQQITASQCKALGGNVITSTLTGESQCWITTHGKANIKNPITNTN